MEKILLTAFVSSCFNLFGQSNPDNLDLGLFKNGTNGSVSGTNAEIEVSVRIKPGGLSYAPIPFAEDLVVYLLAPKQNFAETDVLHIQQVNPIFFTTNSKIALLSQGVIDIGDPDYLYVPMVLNSAGIQLSSLSSETNAWSYLFTISFTPSKSAAQYSRIKILDRTNNSYISNIFKSPVFSTLKLQTVNQLTSSSSVVLPTSLINFSGSKGGAKNTLKWTTASEQNCRGFELQRSSDGTSYTSIGFVNSKAVGGNSNIELRYLFDDNRPVNRKNYYRLNQIYFDDNSRFSNVVVIRGDVPKFITISSVFPNPANDIINVSIDAPQREDVILVIMDVNGHTVKQQLENIEIGSNTVPVAVDKLASGSYFIKVTSRTSEGETSVSKFVRQ